MALEKSRFSSEAGFSLIEVLAATVVMSVALVGLAQLFALSTTANTTARTNTYAALLAQQKMEQLRGLTWLANMSSWGCGGILADDMGLGKTVQVLALLVHEREGGNVADPTLLVCPMSVVGNWQREAERFAPDLRVLVHHGSGRRGGG